MKKTYKYFKKLMAFILIISLFIQADCTTRAAEQILTEGNFQYRIINHSDTAGEVEICGYLGNESEISIPETLGGYNVVSLASLEGKMKSFKKVILGKNIKTVNNRLELSNISGEDNKIEIESYDVVSENQYFSVKDGVLFDKKQLTLFNYPRGKKTTSYIEPSTVTKSYGISENSYLKNLTLSANEKYTMLEDYGYRNSNLEEITLPQNIKIIGEFSFSQCKKLKKINWSKQLERIYNSAFEGCTSLEKVAIPNSVISIGNAAFRNCNLSSVKLSNHVQIISSLAFWGNLKLKKVTIPDSVIKMYKDSFNRSKTKLIMPSYLKKQYRNKEKKFNTYIAKATLTANHKTKDYRAEYIKTIKAKKRKIVLKRGTTRKLNTKAYIYNKNTKFKKRGILKTNILKFASSNKKVVKVTSKGKIKALKKGRATITVTLRTTKQSYKVKIRVK